MTAAVVRPEIRPAEGDEFGFRLTPGSGPARLEILLAAVVSLASEHAAAGAAAVDPEDAARHLARCGCWLLAAEEEAVNPGDGRELPELARLDPARCEHSMRYAIGHLQRFRHDAARLAAALHDRDPHARTRAWHLQRQLVILAHFLPSLFASSPQPRPADGPAAIH